MPNRGTHASLSQGTMPRCGLFLLRSKCSRSLLERFHAFLTDPGERRRTREALPNRHPIPQSNVTDYRVLGNLRYAAMVNGTDIGADVAPQGVYSVVSAFVR